MSKAFKDSEKTEWLIVRVIIGVALLVTLLAMFVIKPTDTTATLWNAVHPFNPFFDTVALAATLFVGAYLGGIANYIVRPIYELVQPRGENSTGVTRWVMWACVLLMGLFYV